MEDSNTIRVLFVDDNESFCQVAKLSLENKSMKVDTVRNGRFAMNLLLSKKYDVIVSDYVMPDLDGINLLKRVRLVDDKIPFILLTGTDMGVSAEAMNAGASGFVHKGQEGKFFFDDLSKKIMRAVEKAREAQQKK
jgi:DNA-binding NtrC family response regulator